MRTKPLSGQAWASSRNPGEAARQVCLQENDNDSAANNNHRNKAPGGAAQEGLRPIKKTYPQPILDPAYTGAAKYTGQAVDGLAFCFFRWMPGNQVNAQRRSVPSTKPPGLGRIR